MCDATPRLLAVITTSLPLDEGEKIRNNEAEENEKNKGKNHGRGHTTFSLTAR